MKEENTVALAIREKDLLVKDIASLDKKVKSFKIKTDEDRENGAVILSAIKTAKKKAEDKRKSFVDPLNTVVRSINAEYKKVLDPLTEYENIVKNEIARDFREQERKRLEKQREEERKREAEQKKLEAEMKKAKDDTSKEIIQNKMNDVETRTEQKISSFMEKKTVSTVVGSSTVKKIWTWRYEKQEPDLSKIPTEYLKVDEGKINTAIRSGVREISGIIIYQTESVASR